MQQRAYLQSPYLKTLSIGSILIQNLSYFAYIGITEKRALRLQKTEHGNARFEIISFARDDCQALNDAMHVSTHNIMQPVDLSTNAHVKCVELLTIFSS